MIALATADGTYYADEIAEETADGRVTLVLYLGDCTTRIPADAVLLRGTV